MSGERRWLTALEVSQQLGVSRLTIYRLCRLHKIPALKLPGLGVRVDGESLAIMLERSVQTQGQPAAAHGKGWR